MKKTKSLAVLAAVLAAILLLSACGSGACPMCTREARIQDFHDARSNSTAKAAVITAKEGKAMLDEGNITLVDVRTQEEYAGGHIQGAILIPNETIDDAMPPELPDKDASIIVYCRSGRRSAEAAEKLTAIGYTKVYDMGGINDWPYETVTE